VVTATVTTTREQAWAAAAAVADPEVPVLTIEDLGVLREVTVGESGAVEVAITPTYSGCPAMDAIRSDVETALRDAGFARVRVRVVLSPAWTTDWMSDDGHRKLREFGIAPPSPPTAGTARASEGPVLVALSVRCPQCGSARTRELSRFGSTACKSLWACDDCLEPFDHFKTLA
jgi:ring-1,2-phenylacetyl-CoA epoxidase subunit PaaD